MGERMHQKSRGKQRPGGRGPAERGPRLGAWWDSGGVTVLIGLSRSVARSAARWNLSARWMRLPRFFVERSEGGGRNADGGGRRGRSGEGERREQAVYLIGLCVRTPPPGGVGPLRSGAAASGALATAWRPLRPALAHIRPRLSPRPPRGYFYRPLLFREFVFFALNCWSSPGRPLYADILAMAHR